jgi:hypothetical protein
MSNVLEGPNPDEMKAGETYRVVCRGETRIGEKRLELEKVEAEKEKTYRHRREVKLFTFTDPRQTRLITSVLKAEQCFSYNVETNDEGKVVSVDFSVDCDNEGIAELLEALTEQ